LLKQLRNHALLDLDDDWDGEGTAGFAEQTWQRVAEPNKDALFYGDDGLGHRTIKGTLDLAAPNRWLTQWLAE
jgi:hypothetical protein